MEDHDTVPSLSHNIESKTHSRLSQCDGRPPIQVQPSSVNRMVASSTGVQANLSKVVHSSCRPVCHSFEPQTLYVSPIGTTTSIRVSYPRPEGLGYRCSKHKLDGCLIIVIAPGWPGMPWFWDLVQLSVVIKKDHLQVKVGPI